MIRVLMMLAALLTFSSAALASGTAKEAKAMLEKVVAAVKSDKAKAIDMFNDALQYRNRYGLLAEDIHPQTGALWGNFPQTYSMAGVILSAMRLSQSWEDRYWHASS